MSAGKGSAYRPVVKAVWDERYQAIDWSALRKEREEKERKQQEDAKRLQDTERDQPS